MLHNSSVNIMKYLVMSATTQHAALVDVARAFNAGSMSGCILTKIDEATSLGGPLSVVIQQQMPVAYVSDGQRVPEDLRMARAHSLVSSGVMLAARTVDMLRKNSIAHSSTRTA
jgi:flagellar biosynthesis protein FlhF